MLSTKVGNVLVETKTLVFLSYSTKDHFFAELAVEKLREQKIQLWRESVEIRAGENWPDKIDRAISNSYAVLVALSEHSSQSYYVTYEWAYAIGNGKPIIPIKLSDCVVHPRLQRTQYLDFSVPGKLPWDALIESIEKIETDSAAPTTMPVEIETSSDPRVANILAYLHKRGYQRASFGRLRRRLGESLTDDVLKDIIKKNPAIFRKSMISADKPGLAKLVP